MRKTIYMFENVELKLTLASTKENKASVLGCLHACYVDKGAKKLYIIANMGFQLPPGVTRITTEIVQGC